MPERRHNLSPYRIRTSRNRQGLARADKDILGLFAERDLARILHAERVLAGLLDDQDAVRGVDRQNRVALLRLEPVS